MCVGGESPGDTLSDEVDDAAGGDALLPERVAVADGDALVLQGLTVHGYAEGRAGFILATVAPAYCALFVVEGGQSG